MSFQRVVFFIFCLCAFNRIHSQITDTTTAVHACAPANISFTAPAGATNVSWTFGSFPPSSNPTGAFNVLNATTFNAIFSGIVGGNPTSFTVPVTVHGRPTASFSIAQPANSCAVKTVTLTNLSSTLTAIKSWFWVYGDGGQNTFTINPNHTYGYTSLGNFSISLQVTDVNNCSDQVTIGTVSVIPSPTAIISTNPPALVGCNSSFSAVFSASNSIGGNLSYSWNFGNGQTSTQMTSPLITFTSQSAQYPVTLTVTSSGCSNVVSTFVTVSPATLSVTVPGTVCMGTPFTATLQTNQPFSLWQLGNSNIISVATPPNTQTVTIPGYPVAGLYTITVSAGVSPCVATPVTKGIFVEQVAPNFVGSTPSVSCSSPFVVSYTNTSTPNATQFSWMYYDKDSVLITGSGSPVNFTLTTGSQNPYAVFIHPFAPTVTLIATSALGCSATVSKSLHTIERPAAWFNTSYKQGCAPFTVTLYDSSIVFPSCPITSYTWCNGAGSNSVTVTGTLALPPSTNSNIPWQNFTYTTPGVYTPYLIIETASNYTNITNTCSDISFMDTIIVVNPPVISFSVAPGNYCPSDTVHIVNTSTNVNVQHWHVDSDNGYFSGCINDPNPKWNFTNVGTHYFTMTGYDHSCPGTYTAGPITVRGPIAKGRFETNCINRMAVTFSIELQEALNVVLNFGDNQSVTLPGISTAGGFTTVVVTHTYPASGNYSAVATASNASTGCSNSVYRMLVKVRDVYANFVSSPTVCAGKMASFNGANSVDEYTLGCGKGYIWYVDNLPPVEKTTSTYNHTFTAAGVHTVILFVKDENSCSDTAMRTIRVSSVTPAFSFNANTICASNPTVQILNTTTQQPDSVHQYFWSFGDGFTYGTNVLSVPVHTYMNANVPSSSYMVALSATNVLGCSASFSQAITVVKPGVYFNPSKTDFCVSLAAPTTITFTPMTSYASYTIDYGVNATSTAVSTGISSYTYAGAGVYSVIIKVKDNLGCENTGSLSINGVQTPTANFIFASPNSTGGNNICSGKLVSFTNTSLPGSPSHTWNLGGGLTNTNNIVSNAYSAPSNSAVAISLSVNTGAPAFCSDVTTKNFTIYAYNANFVASNTVVCLGNALSFSITNASYGLGAWLWSYGDATSSPTLFANSIPPAQTFTSHVYTDYTTTAAGYTSVSLIYWSGDMACKEGKDLLIKVVNIDPDFTRNLELTSVDSAHCINIIDKFNNHTQSNSSTLTYTWNFGNGAVSDSLSPYYMYPSDGVFQVTLSASDENSCKVSAVKNITIFPLPTATILPGDQGYCPNVPFALAMAGSPGVISGTFTPASGISGSPVFTTSTASYSIQAIASESGTYALTVTNDNGCVSWQVDTSVIIVQPPQPIVWDTTVIIGEPIPLNVILAPEISYTWSPVIADLSCTACLNPVSTSTVDIIYTLVMEDRLKCSQVNSTFSVYVLPKATVDLPTAFTPNGDGKNDVIFVDGWGLKKLNYLRIFNRWGQLIFESNDLNIGWDGTYGGVLQNVDTYVYQVSVDTYVDKEPLIKSSTFKLLR